jgi:hypothetical protein
MAPGTWACADIRLDWFIHYRHWVLLALKNERYSAVRPGSGLDVLGFMDLWSLASVDYEYLRMALARNVAGFGSD